MNKQASISEPLTYQYQAPKHVWFDSLMGIVMLLGMAWIIGNMLMSDSSNIWIGFLGLTPLLLMTWLSVKTSMRGRAYRNEDKGKSLVVDVENRSVTIKQNEYTTQIARRELAYINVFESWSQASPMSEFNYVELVLKSGHSHIITSYTADQYVFSKVFRGVKRERSRRWMQRLP